MAEGQLAFPLDADAQAAEAELRRLLARYRPPPGAYDEMLDAEGRVRDHWRPLLSLLAALGPDEIQRRFAAADRYLRESGVFYRVYEDAAASERPWPFSHLPLVLDAGEWRQLEAGLAQRARLIDALLTDIHGRQRLVADGHLPAALVAGNPEYLRPLAGVAPTGGHLRFYAVDVGRGTDGRWWVLGDRTQAPSGAGYALENRLAQLRAVPELHRMLGVRRLAPFFQQFQASLSNLRTHEDSRIALLTPGPLNETHFEHAYLARYLGLLLVEGADLTVRDDALFVRTVSGLKRIEVLVRRLDADFADPLELNARSRLGVPGLLQAVRSGRLAMANGLGSGVAEARALLAVLPALAPVLTGSDLLLPNIATWWLGQPGPRAEVMARFDSMVVASAFSGNLPFYGDHDEMLGRAIDPARRQRLEQAIARRPFDFVLQEAVTLSTMPVWENGSQGGGLVPRPFVLRLYLAKTGHDEWRIMPGGFVRIAEGADTQAVHLQKGGRTADAWVLSEGPVGEATLLPSPDSITIRRATGTLPSRAADNLFWMSRYVERAEGTLRLVRALLTRGAEADDSQVAGRIAELLSLWDAAPAGVAESNPLVVASATLQEGERRGSLPFLVGNARTIGASIRDRFSPDAWQALDDLAQLIAQPLMRGSESAMLERVNTALRIVMSFSGLAQENMSQLAGWRFFELGRRIERAIATCRWLRQFCSLPTIDAALDVMLELCDSQIPYRQRYVMVAARSPVIDLVALDPSNPRSVFFQLDRIETHLATLPGAGADGRLTPAQQVAAGIATPLRTTEAAQFDDALLVTTEDKLMQLSELVTRTYLTLANWADERWEALA